MPSLPRCRHGSNKTFKCSTIKIQDVSSMHRNFYKLSKKVDQDNYILNYCRLKQCERTRLKTGARGPKNMSVDYYIAIKNPQKVVRLCKKAFTEILKIGKDRITGVLQRSFKEEGCLAKENRGGDRRKMRFLERHNKVQAFIESLQAVETHYCRSKSSVRLYLPPDLNIKKLWRMYNDGLSEIPELKVKESFFRKVFNTKYNVGFGSPMKDTCSRCSELTRKIQTASSDQEKQKFIAEKRLHSLKAKAFYDLLRNEEDHVLIASFDCQKNNALPKLPDQAAYFSRQINLFNFTAVVGSSKSPLNNVHIYYWNETDNAKASNQIATAVFHLLTNLDIPQNKTVIRLFADGCGGQNKNSAVIGMCSKWLMSNAPPQIKEINIIFPMVGHSFLPPDRVFAKIEKEIKTMSVISDPHSYVEIFKKHGSVYYLTQDIDVLDWKEEVSKTFKPPGNWHFKFNLTKRFILKRGRQNVSIQGEENYKHEFCVPKYVTKKGMSCSQIEPSVIPKGNKINSAKIKDVVALLTKHYGEDWRNIPSLHIYKNVEETNDSFMSNADMPCVPLEESENFV